MNDHAGKALVNELEALEELREVRDAYQAVQEMLDVAATPNVVEVDRRRLVALMHVLNLRFEACLERAAAARFTDESLSTHSR